MSEQFDELRLPGARALFSTRRGGVSEGPYESLNLGLLTDDEPANVAENRGRLAKVGGLDAARVAMGLQVHGTDLHRWDGPEPSRAYAEPGGKDLPRADGHLTRERGLAMLVLVADCFPVALSDGEQAAILHCGWRPIAGGILEKAIERFERRPEAAVGPGVGGCCYEVGPEVLEHFDEDDAEGRMLDLRKAISKRLAAAGVAEVRHLDRCTSCEPERYFSHRRDRGLTGRQGGMVVLDGR